MRYYIKDNYYFDIDHFNQLRITGPLNHLLLGMAFPKNLAIEIKSYDLVDENLEITLLLPTKKLHVYLPLVTDIRTLRIHTEQKIPRPSYDQLVAQHVQEVIPKNIEQRKEDGHTVMKFTNSYVDDTKETKIYGAEIWVPDTASVQMDADQIHVKSPTKPMELKIRTVTNISVDDTPQISIFKDQTELPQELFSPFLSRIYEETQMHIEHLVRAKKTSSFEYGTIFPRDWIESADLGRSDFNQETVDYMYAQSMNFISEEGEGWHEDVVGAYKYKLADESQHIDRKMVDIEPRYIMGMRVLSKKFLMDKENQRKLRLVAQYILKNARNQEVITFKKVAYSDTEYHFVGNWRDSYYAYPRQKSPLAPYDVNCVFYPLSLALIREYHQYFGVTDVDELTELIEKWQGQKSKFRLFHPDGVIGYSLALHGLKQIPFPIPHLDESYDMFYGSPSLEEISSFARKIMSPDYFYTPVGPVLVARDEDEFNEQQYHGKVIWPKQAAFCVAGLAKQYRRGLREYWPWPVVQTIKEAIVMTCEACFRGWTDLGVAPELYYYDEKQDRARLYTDQEDYEGQMSLIQLWSSVGMRRIIQEYASIFSF